MRKNLNRCVLCSAAMAAAALLPSSLFGATVSQNFDAGPGDFVPGTNGPTLISGSNANFWLNDNKTAGPSGPGEIGGVFVPAPGGQSILADPTIGPGGTGPGLLTLADSIQGSGEFYLGPTSQQTNGAIFIGHMTTNPSDGNRVGIQISDGYRFWCDLGTASSGGGEHSASRGVPVPNFGDPVQTQGDRITLTGELAYTFAYNYDPGTHILHAEVKYATGPNVGLSLGTIDYTASAGDLAVGATVSAWGIEQAGNQGPGTELRLDGVTYTTGNAPPAPTWAANNAGSWLNSSNWVAGQIPNGVGAEANFLGAIQAARTVYADSPVTVGTIHFNNTNMYAISGAGTLTLQTSSGNALVDVQAGTHKINLPLIVASNTTLQTAAGTTLLISDPVTVNAGVSVGQNGGGTVTYQSTVDLQAGASISFSSSQHLAGLSVGDNATARLAANAGASVLRPDSLSISATGGKIDIQDNKMILAGQGSGSFNGTAYTGVSGQIKSGRIITMQAASQGANPLTGIGVATAQEVKGSGTHLWGGQTVGGNDALVMYTYAGDANLDGKIDIVDYGQIDSAFRIGINGWFNGDFNYDGKVDISDYGIIDSNVRIQGAQFPTSGATLAVVTAVPEPTAAAALGALAALAAGRKRRRR